MVATGLAAIAALRDGGRAAEALEALDRIRNDERTAEYYYARGRVLEDLGRYEEALNAYEAALAVNPRLRGARFRLGYLHDLRGDEDKAIVCYEACVAAMPRDTAALMNLGTLYEEKGYANPEYYDRAIECYHQVLDVNANHGRARLGLRDAQAAKGMFYDEEQERRRDKRNQVLEIPVTDFELSVRSRNCLRKMNIRTLGDLIMHTEKDLLSYKNFGETSLAEIKEMLASKGLYLGMGLEQKVQRTLIKPRPLFGTLPAEGAANADIPLDSIEFSVRCRKAFGFLTSGTLGELAQRSEAELLGIKNFGQTSLNEVKQKLRRYGMTLKE